MIASSPVLAFQPCMAADPRHGLWSAAAARAQSPFGPVAESGITELRTLGFKVLVGDGFIPARAKSGQPSRRRGLRRRSADVAALQFGLLVAAAAMLAARPGRGPKRRGLCGQPTLDGTPCRNPAGACPVRHAGPHTPSAASPLGAGGLRDAVVGGAAARPAAYPKVRLSGGQLAAAAKAIRPDTAAADRLAGDEIAVVVPRSSMGEWDEAANGPAFRPDGEPTAALRSAVGQWAEANAELHEAGGWAQITRLGDGSTDTSTVFLLPPDEREAAGELAAQPQ